MISTRDFLLMVVHAQLGDRIVDDVLTKDSELVADVIDALMAWGLDTIQVMALPGTATLSAGLEARQPNGAHVWCRQWITRVDRSPTLAEVFAEMNGWNQRLVDCADHGSGRGVCCTAAQLRDPITPIEELTTP